ncbi:MAG: nucleotide sugar dehydrogenase [Gammaproteobacteria bacterium]|nr:nucleotide sugar dehydrogenase [Gammaproteobacteria bacterium]MCP5136732.1 nucleotide sugar dehydrogenase [Gammaproteobacteria bacterium]
MEDNNNDNNVCVIGLGYVGLTLAGYMAKHGLLVEGIEINPQVHAALAEGRAHFHEFGFDEVVQEVTRNGSLTASYALQPRDFNRIYIITVGTNINDVGAVNLEPIRQVSAGIAEAMRDGDMILLRSTVKLGVTRDVVKPILDQSGKRYDLAFCPERTLEGRALEELASLPQVVGGIDEHSAQRAKRLFERLTKEVVVVDSVEEAEMVKLVNNTDRDVMFAYANEVAMLCEVAGISSRNVIRAVNHNYPRSSVRFPGPVGGPCLGKDGYILAEGFADKPVHADIMITARRRNEELVNFTTRSVLEKAKARGLFARSTKVSVLGTAFKGRPETSDLRGSMVYQLLDAVRLFDPGLDIRVFDPVARRDEMEADGMVVEATLEAALKDAAVVFIQTNHINFENLNWSKYSHMLCEQAIVYDYWDNQRLGVYANSVAVTSLGNSAL